MLIKKLLKEMSPCFVPKASKKDLKGYQYLSSAKITDIQKCGEILVIDFFETSTQKLKARFFSDKNKHIIYLPEENEWTENTIINAFLKDGKSFSYIKDLETAGSFLGYTGWYWCYSCNKNLHGMESLCARAAMNVGRDKREKARERAAEKQRAHFNMFPKKNFKKLDKFCNNTAFEHTYLFFGNKQKDGKRKVVCGRCGRKYNVSADIKHNQSTTCCYCKKKAIYCAIRYARSKKDKSKIVIAHNYEKQLLLEWLNVERTFTSYGEPTFSYEEVSKALYLVENGKPEIYSYNFQHLIYYYGSYWCKKDTLPHCKAYVYTGNLQDIFGTEYYHVNLEWLFKKYPYKIDFVKLLDNLQTDPATEYLCKLGLPVLATDRTSYGIERAAKGFEAVVGVSKQYLPLYRKYQPTADENDIVSVAAKKEFITDNKFEYIRNLNSSAWPHRDCISEVLEHMTLTKMQNYLNKQLALDESRNVSQTLMWMRDYINMCEEMNIELNKRTLFPPDIKKYHDLLAKRINSMRAAKEQEACRFALQIVNKFFTGYSDNTFTIKVPKKRADFIKEGHELGHCVGGQHYYDNHIKGTKMIFLFAVLQIRIKRYIPPR